MTSSGKDLATFRLVEQCLNQLRQLVPLVDGKTRHFYIHKIYMCGAHNIYTLKLYRTQNQVHPHICDLELNFELVER